MINAIEEKRLIKSDYKNYLEKAIDYNEYKRNMAQDLALNPDMKIKEYIHLNQRRMLRVDNTYRPSPNVLRQLETLRHKTYWLILTEHWCGDASQTLPVFHALAQLSQGQIEMRLVYRDQNTELMNSHLTNGTRSIPKLIQLDQHFNVTGVWGPRPTTAQKLVKELKANPTTAAGYAEALHLWYAKDKQQNLEKEIEQLLTRASFFCPDCLS